MGLVQIYCGDGKGKTSAAIGLSIRAAGRGKKVVIARFLKTDNSGELNILRKIPEITVIPCEKSFGFVKSMSLKTRTECTAYQKKIFRQAMDAAKEADLLILDEIMAAVNYQMISEPDLLSFLKKRPDAGKTDGLEIVMTGRNPGEALLEEADYVSEIKKRKHPYDRGIGARIGIEW